MVLDLFFWPQHLLFVEVPFSSICFSCSLILVIKAVSRETHALFQSLYIFGLRLKDRIYSLPQVTMAIIQARAQSSQVQQYRGITLSKAGKQRCFRKWEVSLTWEGLVGQNISSSFVSHSFSRQGFWLQKATHSSLGDFRRLGNRTEEARGQRLEG